MRLGLKLGSKDINYTKDILAIYEAKCFQYIELFAIPETYRDTIDYWKNFSIPMIIHAPHSFAGMNLSLKENWNGNEKKLRETFQFADTLNAEYIIFHAGLNGAIEESIRQLHPFVDSRCLIENKPVKGLNNERCIGSSFYEIFCITNELKMGFCLDFGHAICAANSLKQEPLSFINELLHLQPAMYHLTDGDYTSEYDSHLHYGQGNFPVDKLVKLVPDSVRMTNEAQHDSLTDLNDFKRDATFLASMI
jgi:deoxyribonuclease-4